MCGALQGQGWSAILWALVTADEREYTLALACKVARVLAVWLALLDAGGHCTNWVHSAGGMKVGKGASVLGYCWASANSMLPIYESRLSAANAAPAAARRTLARPPQSASSFWRALHLCGEAAGEVGRTVVGQPIKYTAVLPSDRHGPT